ncbi:TorF family putative porin [Massilia phyllosphaerae]|uniref:TorF family putative porin n=1 Tax=Massilia phyllosphaerae TaxID=3106034 RepID=UPI002B1CDB3F|nr:TorF family putative porin [Massilia sp. SGZ-792]
MHPDRRHDTATFALAASKLAAFTLICLAGPARGQTSADLTLVSEYAGRGIALDTRPALQLRVEHETAAGWYAGAFASPVRLEGRAQGQLVAYGGRAQRLTSTLSWDAGVTRSSFLRDGRWNYREFYAGLASQRASARLFYSPAYYGEGRSLYLDLSGAYPLSDVVRLAAHAGLLHPMGGYEGTVDSIGNSGDARIALVADIGDCTVQAGVQTRWRSYLSELPRASGFTASLSFHF